jgi:hypothetical protein
MRDQKRFQIHNRVDGERAYGDPVTLEDFGGIQSGDPEPDMGDVGVSREVFVTQSQLHLRRTPF